MELGLKRKMIGDDNLYTVFTNNFPVIAESLNIADSYTYGLTSALIKLLTAIFDIPDAAAQYDNAAINLNTSNSLSDNNS